MILLIRFAAAVIVTPFVVLILLGDAAPRAFDGAKELFKADEPRSASRVPTRSYRPIRAPGRPSRKSEVVRRDAMSIVQGVLPIDRDAFDAAQDAMNARPGSATYYRAQGRLIREATKTTGRMLRDSARDALRSLGSRDFWKGIKGR